MNANRAADAVRQTLRQRHRRARRRQVLADANRHESVNSHLRRTRERFVRPVREILGIEMAMRVDEHIAMVAR